MGHTKIHEKTGIIWYRRSVPTKLRGRCPSIPGFTDKPDRRELTRTLDTRDEAEANKAAALIDIEVDKAFELALSAGNAKPSAKSAALSPQRRITPAAVRNAIARWRVGEIEEMRLRAFNGESEKSRFEAVLDATDGVYLIQQFARYPNANADHWRRVPDFDACLIAALTSQGIAIDGQHPAIAHIRPIFAEAWDTVLSASSRVSRSRSEVWGDDSDDAAVVASAPTKEPVRSERLTPFASHLDEWLAQQREMKPRQLDRYAKIVKDFAGFEGGTFVESVKRSQAHRYATSLIADGGKELTTRTVRSILAALRSYWNHLEVNDIAGEARPFTGLKLMKRSGVKVGRFEPEEIVELWQEATDGEDIVLADLIRLAAFTGSRIEAMTQLKADDVLFDPKSKCRFIRITNDKTEAGRRDVPIHSAVEPLIDRCLKASNKNDGFLFATATNNKYGERSTAVGKRFGRMKTRLGYPRAYTFHSIRHTVAYLFERKKVWETIAADILGHAKPSMTYGLYAGDTYMGDRKEAIEAALGYPSDGFMTAK